MTPSTWLQQRRRERRTFQRSRRGGGVAAERPCGCGSVLLEEGEEPRSCRLCIQRAKALLRAGGEKAPEGTCAACGESAPGLCGVCDGELTHGRMPKVTSPVAWKRMKAGS